MKRLVGLTAIIGGLLFAVVPRYILPACEYEGFARMHCSDTAQAELAIGSVLIATGILTLALKYSKTTAAGAAVTLVFSVIAFTLPEVFGYCHNSRMPCNYGMVPAIRFVAVVSGLVMIIVLLAMVRVHRKKGTA